jgi:U3 small nucleolar RNA-associated protein 19
VREIGYHTYKQFSLARLKNIPAQVPPNPLLLYDVAMPGTLSGAESAVKRKKKLSAQKPSKRPRAENNDDMQSRVLDLEKQILESKKNYNNISALIKLAKSESDDGITCFAASVALCRVFIGLMAAGELTKKQGQTEKDSVVYRWLQERYAEYKASLVQLLAQGVAGPDALTLCMRLLKNEGVNMRNGSDYSFPITFLREILRSILGPGVHDTIRNEFCQKYLNKYVDIRFYAISSIE